MENQKPKLCLNCLKRHTCKSKQELENMESNLLQCMQAVRCYGGDPKEALEKLIETHKDELVCSNYEVDKF